MARIKLVLPDTFRYSTTFPVRITDLNYGNHAGNDAILAMLHEARVRFLAHHGYSELNVGGVGLIMADVAIQFRQELFYGDLITASVAVAECSSSGFELYYKLEKESENRTVVAVQAKTAMVCYNYELRKVVALPEGVAAKLQS